MKKLITAIAILAIGLATVSAADTNVLQSTSSDSKSESGSWEFTLGGGGVNVANDTSFGLDVGISTNPLKALPSLWFGLNQGFAWEPTFSGSSDVNVNWSWHVYKSLYLNTGWSVGAAYDQHTVAWRTGPEVTFQYYIGDSAFLFAGANYDIQLDRDRGPNGFRYSFGIGLAF
jgi:hypothetical protein